MSPMMLDVFIRRPILSSVISLLLLIAGGVSYFTLPVSQYPDVVPPTIVVSASLPGASAEVVSRTVSTPLEQQINGVDNMLYMTSQATGDGQLSLVITFRLGTNLDDTLSMVQSRVAAAQARLPTATQHLGVSVQKTTPDLMMVVHMWSPGGTRDPLYLSNYATLHVRDVLARIHGVGELQLFGDRDYAMRVWLDPDRIAARGLSAVTVLAALRAQNIDVAPGALDSQPMPSQGAYQVGIRTVGRLTDPSQFEDIIVRTDSAGRVTRIRDIGRVEL